MSLATRCFACGTVFRVVQDQLKVSEGWVRCGRCNEVFNALDSLFDLERDTPPAWSPGASTPVAAAAVAPPAQASSGPDPLVEEESLVDRIDAWLEQSGRKVCLQAMASAMHAIGWTHKKRRPRPASAKPKRSKPDAKRSR